MVFVLPLDDRARAAVPDDGPGEDHVSLRLTGSRHRA